MCAAIKHSNPFLSLPSSCYLSVLLLLLSRPKKKTKFWYFISSPLRDTCAFDEPYFTLANVPSPRSFRAAKKKPKGRRDVEPRGSKLFILLENFFLLPLKKFLPLRKEQLKTFSSRYVSRFFFRACVIRKPLAQGILIIILFLKKTQT